MGLTSKPTSQANSKDTVTGDGWASGWQKKDALIDKMRRIQQAKKAKQASEAADAQ
jgi:hypothetical protein